MATVKKTDKALRHLLAGIFPAEEVRTLDQKVGVMPALTRFGVTFLLLIHTYNPVR